MKQKSISIEKETANWYVMRELCYGAMFRYNRKGEFNIPYGGSSYNRKSLRTKVSAICSHKVQHLVSNARFSIADFEVFLDKTKPTKNDFVFVDPPYDTAFSEYDTVPFTKDDHGRLLTVLLRLKAKWLLVIKETDYITWLYSNKGLHISAYKKQYRHNIQGRTQQEVNHLTITNYSQCPPVE